jgi:hypothetical protein
VKRPALFVAMLIMVLVATVPAIAQLEAPTIAPALDDQYEPAQENIVATGTLVALTETAPYEYGTHTISDEASDAYYRLRSAEGLLSGYEYRRVTVYGTVVPGSGDDMFEGGPPLVEVTCVKPEYPEVGDIPDREWHVFTSPDTAVDCRFVDSEELRDFCVENGVTPQGVVDPEAML